VLRVDLLWKNDGIAQRRRIVDVRGARFAGLQAHREHEFIRVAVAVQVVGLRWQDGDRIAAARGIH
jgi:hypothetical protein